MLILQLESFLGPRIVSAVLYEIEQKYLGGEISARQCLTEKPDLFERAIVSIMGPAGEVILAGTWQKTLENLKLNPVCVYSKVGDLQKCVALVRSHASYRKRPRQ